MNSLFNRKSLIGVVLLIVLSTFLLWYFSFKSNQKSEPNEPIIQEVMVPQVEASEGWQVYTGINTQWKGRDQKVAFAYPRTWILKEEKINEDLNALTIEGDGYSMRIDQAGRGMSRPYDYIRSIGGLDARTWEEKTTLGTKFTFGITSVNFVVYATTQNESRETIDKILSSMVFYK